jgi:hypothetical protein
MDWRRVGYPAQSGCTGHCPVCQTSLGEQATLETQWRHTTINHRTVQWCTGLSGESSAVKSLLSRKIQRCTAKIQRRTDCPVHHPTEGTISLPRMPPMAPSYLGAIKGTPRRMEESPKHTLSILSLPHSVSTHLINCVSDLSSVLVVNSLCFILSSSLGLCACVLLQICVCCFPSLL